MDYRLLPLLLIPLLTLATAVSPDWDSIHDPSIAPMPYQKSMDVSQLTQAPDLKWKPIPYSYKPDTEARYIDYEKGNDSNPGTMQLPWKHHPWDINATGKAASTIGVRTFVFKKGVMYRGQLFANESGEQGQPIRLTVDPSWGIGHATFSGSLPIRDGWTKCGHVDQKQLPASSRFKTWCRNVVTKNKPRLLWSIQNNQATRIPLARYPNWSITDQNDPRSDWLELTDSILELKIYLESTQGFSVGDIIQGHGSKTKRAGKQGAASMPDRVIKVTEDYIRVESNTWGEAKLRKGDLISNGKTSSKILKVSGTHHILRRLQDKKHLGQVEANYYKGAVMWAEGPFLPTPIAGTVLASDPSESSVTVNFHRQAGSGPGRYSRYFLEGLIQFLDSPGEYYFREISDKMVRIYLRLPEDKNPNEVIIEFANTDSLLTIENQSNIEISGLHFNFSNQVAVGTQQARHASLHASAIQIRGSSSNISVHHCAFAYLSAGIVAYPARKGNGNKLDNIVIAHNEFNDIDGTAIALGTGRERVAYRNFGARLVHVRILSNRMKHIGYRTLTHWGLGAYGHGIDVNGGEIVEIAGNHIDRAWGSGIKLLLGSDYERGKVVRPLLRGLIHHNKVTNSLLGLQDYGGIASWMGGPIYIYNNISGNPVGYIHARARDPHKQASFKKNSYGVGIYLDGQYKGYVFNNIVWGLNNNINDRIYNAAAVNEAMGFMNTVFQNTLFNFGVGLHKGMSQHNRSYYLGNLVIAMGHMFIQHEPSNDVIDYKTIAYSHNVFHGTPTLFGQLGRGKKSIYSTLAEWMKSLRGLGVLEHSTGIQSNAGPIRNGDKLDFRLKPDSAAIDRGVKVFVPWSLKRVVGEWHFYRSPVQADIVFGENINMNKEWVDRSMYQAIPRNNLQCHNVDESDYSNGLLEDWIAGALRFNGRNQYCKLEDAELKRGYRYQRWGKKEKESISSGDRDTVDIGSGNFLIEAVIAPTKGHTGGGITSKLEERGYYLSIDEHGMVKLTIDFGDTQCSRTSSVRINDGKWHHVIAEVNRSYPKGIRIFVDGVAADGRWSGNMNHTDSISNDGDFNVGRQGDSYFSGQIDFLRVAKGSLADAETSIDELYEWEFSGPFLKDFQGNTPSGKRRDAGAVEHMPI